MTLPILLTGGTGTLGRLVAPLLRDAGCDVRILSRTSRDPGDGIDFVTGEVAARLVELSLSKPAGLVPDVAGPRVYEMRELVRSYLRAQRKHRLMVPVKPPGKAAAAIRRALTWPWTAPSVTGPGKTS